MRRVPRKRRIKNPDNSKNDSQKSMTTYSDCPRESVFMSTIATMKRRDTRVMRVK